LTFRTKFDNSLGAYLASALLLGVSFAKLSGLGLEFFLPAPSSLSQKGQDIDTKFSDNISTLFGKGGGANLAVSPENIKLKAIYKSKTDSFAYFSDGNGSFFLKPGESKNGVTLENIFYEKVSLTRGGKRFELSLEYAYFPSADRVSAQADNKLLSISKELLSSYIQNPTKMMEDIRLDVKGGAVFIAGLTSGTLFDIAGFKEKDIILSVDATAIKNPVDLVGALRVINEKSSFSATIERNGAKKEMRYEIK